ncbi:MAG: hypothetical protein U0R69_09240 [Gaiellales bacterium]
MLRLFPVQITTETGEAAGSGLVVQRLCDPAGNLYYRLEDGRIGEATLYGRGCTLVDPAQLPPLHPVT